ncbi:MAG: 4'-phosphopantetheinyl transferase superfamily protein [Candidatus Margulisiibacteriota bacterium]|nr:4'-phosphopantetheinyl transferase superfamily protein [Candidatus Margulisiibacteriota bacterium]
MTFAVGNDIVFIPDFEKSLSEPFKKRVFSELEIDQIEKYKACPLIRYASTWAAKESVVKALRQVFDGGLGLAWKDIQVIRENKIPGVRILMPRYSQLSFSLSLSHDRDYAFAVVVLKK